MKFADLRNIDDELGTEWFHDDSYMDWFYETLLGVVADTVLENLDTGDVYDTKD